MGEKIDSRKRGRAKEIDTESYLFSGLCVTFQLAMCFLLYIIGAKGRKA